MSLVGSTLLMASTAKTISVTNLTLNDSPQAARFTSATFAVTLTADKAPTDIKLKAWITGVLKAPLKTSAIATVDSTTAGVTYSATGSGGWASGPLSSAFDGNLGTWAQHNIGQPDAVWDASSYGLGGQVEMYGTCNNTTIDHVVKVNGTTVTYNPGVTAKWVTLGTFPSLTSISIKRGANSSPTFHALRVNGVLLVDGATTYTVTMVDNTSLATVTVGDAFIASGGATGVVAAVNSTTKVVTLAAKTGTITAGDVIEIPSRLVTDGVSKTLYLSFTAAGVVASTMPTQGDVGYQAFTMTGSYNGTLTFPATVAGTATDTQFPAGTKLSIQAQISDGLTSATSSVVTITPA